MKKILSVVILGSFLIGSFAQAGDRNRTRSERRLPEYEVHTSDRYIRYERSGGRGNDGTIHFMNKRTVRRRYKSDRRSVRNRCTDEKGRRVSCK
jgi:Ni/Co efflux regulator RcnB